MMNVYHFQPLTGSSAARKVSRVAVSRAFQSLSQFHEWREDVRLSTMPTVPLSNVPLAEAAPFLQSVDPMADHLVLAECSTRNATIKSPKYSLLQCTFPLSTDDLLRNSVADISKWSSFRLGKFYEVVDALTADVAYRHCDNDENQVSLVTAGHYNSRKLFRTNIQQDVMLRCYVTSVGTSSMEVRTDALQRNGEDRVLVNVCHTIMVALDRESGKPLGKVGRKIAPLELESQDDVQRERLAKQHAEIRKTRSTSIMQLRSPMSQPPTMLELQELHKMHQTRASHLEKKKATASDHGYSPLPRVADYTFRSSTVIYPEQRNVHGKLFGGFVMEESEKLAQYTASFFAKGEPVVPLGIDEAIFLQPIAIGDMVTFTARLVHSTTTVCRVLVHVEVRDPARRDEVPLRSNRLLFVFGGSGFPSGSGIIPESYSEILMHVDALRRYNVEGPTEECVKNILQESQTLE